MDYADGKKDGIYQFNTRYRKKEVCRALNEVIDSKCFTSFPPPVPECGNGVVELDEECECPSGTSCNCCNACRLTANSQCGGGECCDKETCRFKAVTETCGGGICNAGSCEASNCARQVRHPHSSSSRAHHSSHAPLPSPQPSAQLLDASSSPLTRPPPLTNLRTVPRREPNTPQKTPPSAQLFIANPPPADTPSSSHPTLARAQVQEQWTHLL